MTVKLNFRARDKKNKSRVKIKHKKIKQQENPSVKSKQQEKKLMETQWQLKMKPWSFFVHLPQFLISDLVTCSWNLYDSFMEGIREI